MTASLFEILDLDSDGQVSRTELHTAARQLGWHWREAPLFALLDLLTISEPISENKFTAYMQQIAEDPLGPYGRVLLESPHFYAKMPSRHAPRYSMAGKYADATGERQPPESRVDNFGRDLVPVLERSAGKHAADTYRTLIDSFDLCPIKADGAALLIIDPQRSFTGGVWMASIGDMAVVDVEPIGIAFEACAALLEKHYGRMEIMFTRCPFPPDSYNWDDRLSGILDKDQLYFVKPGNSVLFPPANGFREWVKRLTACGKRTLIIGGCTLNSCVRVSSIETLSRFKSRNLHVVVDLSLCGARTRNFIPSSTWGGLSAVESAVNQMTAAGVRVVKYVKWT